MRILITGGAGFIGHHVTNYLLAEEFGHELTLLDRLDGSGNLNRLAEICAHRHPRCRFVFHDLRAPINDLLAKQLGVFDAIVHMAAATHVDRSISFPMEFVQDNVVATCNLLDYARQAGCGQFLQFSTDEVFGPAPEGVRYKEDDRFDCSNPYSATKAGAEVLALAYWKTFKVPVMVTHTMNVIGVRQHPEKFIPNTIAKLLANQKIIIHANADQGKPGSRYYIDVLDVCRAVDFLLRNGSPGEKYNVVGASEWDNLEVATAIWRAMDKPHGEMSYELVDGARPGNRPGHDLRYALSGQKMAGLGWYPREDINDTLDYITQWTLRNRQWLMST